VFFVLRGITTEILQGIVDETSNGKYRARRIISDELPNFWKIANGILSNPLGRLIPSVSPFWRSRSCMSLTSRFQSPTLFGKDHHGHTARKQEEIPILKK
jgi:hypothetical protein